MGSLASRNVIGVAVLLAAASVFAQAPQVYRYVDPSGRVVYSDRPPPPDVKNVQTKRMGANFVETSEPSLAAQQASDRFPATLFTFDCGDICQNAEALLNKRGVPFAVVNVQTDEQGFMRMKSLTGEERAPVLTLGDKIIVKGFNDARWQAALDEAGYPKTPPPKRGAVGAREPSPQASAPVEGDRAVAPGVRGGDYPK
ncbi:MAG TPA: glutaredoxin family protein [Casimicrobiaceae bacterium]|nr:glutaredoxin family protein [Casimicrobiaceae bacterium]